MFEAVFARMLKALLGEFVEDIGGVDNKTSLHDKIQLGVWSGYICLEHLVLKDKLLQMLGLPLQLAYGVIGRLELRIPWGNLGGEPVVVIVDRINILLQPKYEWDPKALDNREQTIKQAKLVAAELFANRRLDDGETSRGIPGIKNFAKRWLMDSIINKLVENIQVTVRDVHIRYEDHISCPSDFCVGITLESLHAQSREGNISYNNDTPNKHDSKTTDEELKRLRGKDVDIDESNCIRKMVQIDHLSVYWNPLIQSSMDACTSTFLGRTPQEIEILMMRIIAKRNHHFIDRLKHHYILFPVDMRTDIDARFDPISGKTEVRATINIANISVEFEDRQFREIVSLVSNMKSFDKLGKFSKYRPTLSIADSINEVKEYLEKLRKAGSLSLSTNDIRDEKIGNLLPDILRLIEAGDSTIEALYTNLKATSRAWLQYSVNAAVYQMRTERRKFTGKELHRRIQDKYVYVELWKKKLETKSSAVKKSNSEPVTANIDNTNSDSNIFSEQDPHEYIRSGQLYQTVLSIARRKKAEKSQSVQNSNRKSIKEPYSLAEGMDLLIDLERILSFEDIVVFRSIAENDFSQIQSTNGWLGGVLAWATGVEESEEERRKLFEALKYDPELVLRGSSNYNQDPEEAVATIVVLLEKGSIKLSLSSPSVTSSFSLPFLMFRLTSLNVKTNILNVGTSLEVKLDNIEAFEMMASEASDTQTSHFLMERDVESNMVYNQLIKRRLPTETDLKYYKSGRSPISPASEHSALFEAFIQLMPPSTKELEVIVELELRELIIMVSPAAHWVKSISSFFKFPDDLLFWSELEMTTMNQIVDLKSRVNAKLEYMISTHANLKLEADIKAPVIVIAESGVLTDGSEMLVIDLGNINLTTEKLAKAMLEKSMVDESVSNAGDRSDATPNRMNGNNDITPSRAINYKEKFARPREAFANDISDRKTPIANDCVPDDDRIDTTPTLANIQKNGSTDANEAADNIGANFQSRVRSNTNGASTVNGMDFDGTVQESLFDVFQVIVKDIEVYMTTSVSSIFATDIFFDEDEFLKRVPIVDKFDISVEIQVSTLPWDVTIPPVKLYVEFPEINVRLSDHKLVRLALFSNKLLHSSKSIIDEHRNKVDKLIAAMNHRSNIVLVSNDITELNDDDDDDFEFYDAETDKRSASNDRVSNDGKTLSRVSAIERKRHGRPRCSSNLSDHSSHNSSSSNSKAFSARGSTTSSQFLDTRSIKALKYNERNSLNSSFIEDDENDDMSTCSEDSFLSAEEEHPKDTAKRIENLHYSMKQRENMRKKLMSEMRIIEGETSSKAQALYNSLQEELNSCEKELHHLKLEYLELRMLADGSRTLPATDTNNNVSSDLHGLFDALLLPVKSQEDLVRRRKIMRTNIFKSRPQVIQRRRKELMYLQVNLSVMNIILSKHNSESTFPSPVIQADPFGIDILKLRLAGVSLKVKHWNTDTKMTLIMRELDIQDAMETSNRYNDNHSIVFLMSSEPSASGIYLSQDRYVSTDLVRLRYDVSYGHEINSNNSKIVVNDRHQVRLTFGFLGFNIAQETLLALCQVGEALQETVVVEKKEDEDNWQGKSVGFSADAAISIKCKGFHFSLLQNKKPSLSLSIWSINALSQINLSTAVMNFSIADISMHHYVETHAVGRDNKTYQKKLIFGRKVENLPSVTIASKIHMINGLAVVQDMTIRLTSTRLVLVPSCVSSILAQLYDGALAKHFRSFQSPPPQSTTFTLDMFLSPLISLCSGQVDVALGEIDISFPSEFEGQPLAFSFGFKEILCKIRWGSVCVHGGAELLLMVNGINANIAQFAIVQPFNFCSVVSTKSRKLIAVNDEATSLQSHIHSTFKPKFISKVNDNELHVSASTSPIIFNASERLIYTFGSWLKENVLFFEAISNLVSADNSSIMDTIDTDEVISSSFDSLGFKLKKSLLLYEVAVALNADTPSTGGKDKNHSKIFTGSEFTSPLFYLSLRNLHLITALYDDHNLEIDERFLIDLDVTPRLFTNVTLKSIDFEYKRAGVNSLKRLICTATEEKSTKPNDNIDDIHDICDVMHTVDIKCEISPEWAVDLHVNVSNVQVTVLSEAVITLATLGTLYQTAAVSSFLQTALPDLVADSKLKKKILNDEFARILLKESAHAHPSSVPLSMSASTMISAEEKKPRDPKNVIIISKRSFYLPSPLRSLNVNVSLQSCGIWMPSDDDNAHALAIYVTSDIEFSTAFHPIEWPHFSEENDTQCFWTSRLNLTSSQVYLSRVRHLQIFKKLLSLTNTDELTSLGGGNENSILQQPIKSIVMPFSAQLLQSLLVIKNDNDNELKFNDNSILSVDVAQKVEAYIQEMELLGFLDFRTFLQIYKNSIKPLVDIVTTASTDTKSKEPSFNESILLNESTSLITLINEQKIVNPKSVFELFPILGEISTTSVQVAHDGLSVFIINDLYRQPVTIARIVCSILKVDLLLNASDRRTGIIRKTGSIEFNEFDNRSYQSASTRIDRVFHSTTDDNTQTKSSSLLTHALLSLNACASVCVEYHNQNLMAWEPLLEPLDWSVDFKLPMMCNSTDGPILWNLEGVLLNVDSILPYDLLKNDHLDDLSNGGVHLDRSAKVRASLRDININVTVALLESLRLTIKSLSKLNSDSVDRSRSKIKEKVLDDNDAADLSMMIIRNDSGLMMKYWCSDISRATDVPPNTEKPLHMDTESGSGSTIKERSFDPLSTSRSVSLSLQRPGADPWPTLRDVPLDGTGCRLFLLELGDDDGFSNTPKKNKIGRVLRSPSYPMLASNNSVCIAAELLSRGGVRTLVIRSTIRLNNSTQIPLHVQLISAYPKRDILWDAVIPAGAEMSVPANYCSISNGRFFLQPLVEFAQSYSRGKRSSPEQCSTLLPTEILVPEIPGQTVGGRKNNTQESDQGLDDETDLISQTQNIDEFLKNSGNNSLRWRRKLLQKRGTVDSLSYCHWLIFNKQADNRSVVNSDSSTRISCNVEVLSQGAPRSNKTRNADSFMLRTLTFTSPVSIVNLLRSDVEVVLFNGLESASLINNNAYAFPLGTNVVSLRPGESYGCVAFHSLEKVNLSIRISNASKDSLWSNIVVIPSCTKDQKEDTTFTADLKFPNGSVLTVLLDVVDQKGHRIINLYVPYWIVSSSFITLQYQHDARSAIERNSKVVNGLDGLAADQLFDEKRNPKEGRGTLNFRKIPLRGIGKSRGIGGIVLGPELPIRGLADILVNNRPSEFGKLITKKPDEFSLFSNGEGALETLASGVDLPSHYHLIQCSYTNFDRRSGRLRLRGNGTNWSNFFNLDATTSTSVDIETSRKYADPDENAGSSGRIPSRSGAQVFCFGIFTTTADPPFQRTRVTVVVDRYILLNSMGQSLEARQFGNEDVTTVHPNDQCPFWWRPGNQLIQIRLARYGWAWSGRFSVKREGEIPLRLRNEHDNTVFFVLVHVLKQGPRICIVFKGGDSVAPYRIENHTLETFKLRQVTKKGWRQDQNLQPKQTSLLPYHTCAYAWDEPLAPQEIVIELLKNGQSRSEMVGTFSFNRLETFPVKNNLIIRLIAQGPTRVLCIHDHRISVNPGITNKPEPALVNRDLFKLCVNIASLGISIIDQTPQELIYISVTDVSVDYTKSIGEDSLKTEVGRVQVDSQILNTPFPSMIYPLKHEEDEIESEKKQSGILPSLTSQLYVMSRNTLKPVFLSLEIIRNFTYPGVMFIPTLRLKISPFDVNIEGVVISRLYSMISNFMNENVDIFTAEITSFQPRSNQIYRSAISVRNDLLIGRKDNLEEIGSMTTTNRHHNSSSVDDLGVETLANVIARRILELSAPPLRLTQPSPKIYLQHMVLSDLRLNVSFSAEGINPVINSIVASGDSIMSNALSTVIIAMFSTALKIDNCPLRFSTYSLDNAFLSVDDLGGKLGFDYAMQAAGQAHLILGSSELLGNVVQLLQLLKEGLWDFMYLPAIGLMTSPQAFGSGVVKGFSSLLRFTAVSLCSTVGHFSSSLQIGLVTLGVIDSDTTFQEERGGPTSFVLQNRPKGGIDGLKQGFNDLVQLPILGFHNDGLRGLITGTLKGFLRLFAKPIYGLLGTAYQATDRISFRLLPRVKKDQKHRLKRSRPPRFFHSPHLPLQIYSADENMGQELLSRVHMGAFKSEGYICHYRLREGTILVVTTIRVMVVGDSFDFCQLHWECALSQFLFLEIDYDRNLLLIPDLSFIENQSKSSQGSNDSEIGTFINVLTNRRAASLDTTSNMSLQTMNVSDDGKSNGNTRLKSLKGQPTLHIYFLPAVETFSRRATYKKGDSAKCNGFKLRHQAIGLPSHEQLIDLLRHLIKKAPYLATDDVETYIKDCGLKVVHHGPMEDTGGALATVNFNSHGSNLSSQGQSSQGLFPPTSPKSKRGMGPSSNSNASSQLFLLPISRPKGPSSSIFMYRESSRSTNNLAINSINKTEKLPSVYEGDDPLERSFTEDAAGDTNTNSARCDSTEDNEDFDFEGESILGPT